MNTKPLSPLSQQSGKIAFWHLMLLVAFAVGLALFLNAKGTTFFTRTIPSSLGLSPDSGSYRDSSPRISNATFYSERNTAEYRDTRTYRQEQEQAPVATRSQTYDDDLYEPRPAAPSYGYDEQYPPRLAEGYYTVQVFSGYNSKQAFDLRRALAKDGYNNVHIREIPTSHGILFKVRIGRYRDRIDAFSIKSQVRNRYPNNLGRSFVLLVEEDG